MRIADILQPQHVKVPLVSAVKQDAIFELVAVLQDAVGPAGVADMQQAVWHRETTRTTGIGHGIAIPHGKCASCKTLTIAMGRPAKPLEFGAIDRRPVELIILLASPIDQTGPHIHALAAISKMLFNDDFRAAAKHAATSQELFQLFISQEAGVVV